MSPVFSHGDLRLYLLFLLSDAPRHGYELMQALAERTGGTYTPSAGTIYPRLAKLEDDGLVLGINEGRRTVYQLTDAGRAELAARADELNRIERGLSDSVRLIADEVRGSVREAMRTLKADLAAAAQEERRGTSDRGPGARPERDDARVESRVQLQRADAALNKFRLSLRTRLRAHVVRGGDGTVRAVAEYLAETKAAAELGIVPLGTGNLLARNLGIAHNDLSAAFERAIAGEPQRIDLGWAAVELDGRVERHAFAVMAGFGIDAHMITETNDDLKEKAGWLAYVESLGRAVSASENIELALTIEDEIEGGDELGESKRIAITVQPAALLVR